MKIFLEYFSEKIPNVHNFQNLLTAITYHPNSPKKSVENLFAEEFEYFFQNYFANFSKNFQTFFPVNTPPKKHPITPEKIFLNFLPFCKIII